MCPSVRPSLRIILRALRAGVSLVSSAPFYSLVSSAPFYSSVTLSPDFRSVSSAPIYSPASPAPGSRRVSSAPLPSAEASSSGLLKKEIPPGASLRSIRSGAFARELRSVLFARALYSVLFTALTAVLRPVPPSLRAHHAFRISLVAAPLRRSAPSPSSARFTVAPAPGQSVAIGTIN